MTIQGKITLPPLHHIGTVVKDIEKAAEYYSATFGIGPFTIRESFMENVLLRGRPVSPTIKVGSAKMGSIEIELLEPVEGESVYAEFLSSQGEGLHHVGFSVTDIEDKLAILAKEGIMPIFNRKTAKSNFAYLNSDQVGGVIIELLQRYIA